MLCMRCSTVHTTLHLCVLCLGAKKNAHTCTNWIESVTSQFIFLSISSSLSVKRSEDKSYRFLVHAVYFEGSDGSKLRSFNGVQDSHLIKGTASTLTEGGSTERVSLQDELAQAMWMTATITILVWFVVNSAVVGVLHTVHILLTFCYCCVYGLYPLWGSGRKLMVGWWLCVIVVEPPAG